MHTRLIPGFPRNPSLASLPLLSTVCSVQGPRAPARQMVVRLILRPCLEGREDPENQPNLVTSSPLCQDGG